MTLRKALYIGAAVLLAAAPAAHAEGSSVTHQHIPGKKTIIDKSIFDDQDASAAPADTENNKRTDPAPKSTGSDYNVRLDENNLRRFIEDVQKIAIGEADNMSEDEISDYLNQHIAADARFISGMRYEMPGFPTQENTMDIGKTEYINGVLNGAMIMDRYEHSVTIKAIDIAPGGRSAKVTTSIRERGNMPWPEDTPDPSGNVETKMTELPVQGESTCVEHIILSLTNLLQMKGAQCQTLLSFDPFEKQELGDDMFFGKGKK